MKNRRVERKKPPLFRKEKQHRKKKKLNRKIKKIKRYRMLVMGIWISSIVCIRMSIPAIPKCMIRGSNPWSQETIDPLT